MLIQEHNCICTYKLKLIYYAQRYTTVTVAVLFASASRPCPYSDDRRCKTSQACIRADRWCNQQIDCMDESDEEDCCKLNYCKILYLMYCKN